MVKRKRGNKASTDQPVRSTADASRTKLSINSYEDIPDSEDEFHINRDKVLLGDGPDAKRQKKWQQEDEFLESSDEEVLGYSDNPSEAYADSEIGDEELKEGFGPANGRSKAGASDYSDEEENANPDEEDEEGWGPTKSDYYDADVIETEQDALDEEAEALRIQQKQLKALKESDFAFDEQEWFQDDKTSKELDANGERRVITEVLPQISITEEMGVDERMKLLRSRYPEFEPLAKELLELQPLHEDLALEAQAAEKKRAAGPISPNEAAVPVAIMKYQALTAYLSALAMYFVILSSTAQSTVQDSLPMPPSELREHSIMTTLVECRDVWSMTKDLVDPTPEWSPDKSSLLSSDPSESALQLQNEWKKGMSAQTSPPIASSPSDPAAIAALARRKEKLRRTEENLATLSSLAMPSARSGRPSKSHATNGPSVATSQPDDLDSDIGDEPALAPHEVAEKARKKKSLRFYTSQIAQKANKRANAGRMAGGDDDLPYRERFRDRQMRLNEQAEQRGKRDAEADDVSDDDNEETNLEREQRGDDAGTTGDQYSQWLEERTRATKAKKQAEKLRRAEAYAAEHGGEVVERESETVGVDGRRQIGYTIEKNKGLTPRRKKEVRNPRVKKRMKYEEKKKKLGSMKPIYKGGEGRGGYGGEMTGIKKGLVRSVKL